MAKKTKSKAKKKAKAKKKIVKKAKQKTKAQKTADTMLEKYGTLKAMQNEQDDLTVAIKQVGKDNKRIAKQKANEAMAKIAKQFGVKKSDLQSYKPKKKVTEEEEE